MALLAAADAAQSPALAGYCEEFIARNLDAVLVRMQRHELEILGKYVGVGEDKNEGEDEEGAKGREGDEGGAEQTPDTDSLCGREAILADIESDALENLAAHKIALSKEIRKLKKKRASWRQRSSPDGDAPPPPPSPRLSQLQCLLLRVEERLIRYGHCPLHVFPTTADGEVSQQGAQEGAPPNTGPAVPNCGG